jgi:DNA primase
VEQGRPQQRVVPSALRQSGARDCKGFFCSFADAAGQGAAQRFYEWEERYQMRVSVARFPAGRDPGDLAHSDPEALRHAVEQAQPFLGFRVNRVLNSRKLQSPEDRALVAGEAMTVVNEHPNPNIVFEHR